jgi:hypothetical protein
MNTVYWSEIFHSSGKTTLSLLEHVGISEVRFLASINTKSNEDGKYEFCAFSKDRVLQTVPKEQYADTIDEAKKAVEEYLEEQGIYVQSK